MSPPSAAATRLAIPAPAPTSSRPIGHGGGSALRDAIASATAWPPGQSSLPIVRKLHSCIERCSTCIRSVAVSASRPLRTSEAGGRSTAGRSTVGLGSPCLSSRRSESTSPEAMRLKASASSIRLVVTWRAEALPYLTLPYLDPRPGASCDSWPHSASPLASTGRAPRSRRTTHKIRPHRFFPVIKSTPPAAGPVTLEGAPVIRSSRVGAPRAAATRSPHAFEPGMRFRPCPSHDSSPKYCAAKVSGSPEYGRPASACSTAYALPAADR
mmetsp:Transcript_8516/g.27098  ORF Transcript_8516/g.27098 Transcript_8516/m.27098 type:complete len:269 (+) Transcript_8516:411-1217(+)